MAKAVVKKSFSTKVVNWANKATEVAEGAASFATKTNDFIHKTATTNMDAISNYLFGQGKTVKLTDIAGVSDTLVKTALKTQIDQVNQELLGKWLQADTPYVSVQENNAGYWGSKQDYDLTYSQMLFMGDGRLSAYLKSDGERAQIHYYIRDKFTNPGDFDSITFFKGDIAPPYKVDWDTDSRWYSIADAKSTVGVVGTHDYSWLA